MKEKYIYWETEYPGITVANTMATSVLDYVHKTKNFEKKADSNWKKGLLKWLNNGSEIKEKLGV